MSNYVGVIGRMMPRLEDRGALKPSSIRRMVEKFTTEVEKSAQRSAVLATRATVDALGPNLRPNPGPRAGRNHSNRLKTVLQWRVTATGDVEFDQNRANAQNRYWIIQEIGTNARATMRVGGSKNPRGRARSGADYIRTIPAQRGRLISRGLAFGTNNGVYAYPGSARNQQLYLASKLRGVPSPRTQLVISKEISGRHFVKKGGQQGFRAYQTSVIAAARQAFAGHPYRP